MAAPGITVLKNNVPWGPFTRAQIEDGLTCGDFTVKYFAHASGLKEWLPLGEVLDYVERSEGSLMLSLPPIPEARELPPMPPVPDALISAPPARPPILPATIQPARPPPPSLPISPVIEKREMVPEPKLQFRSEVELTPASLFQRGIAFLIDCAVLFMPVVLLYAVVALSIVISGLWNHLSHQAKIEQWEWLDQSTWHLAWLVLIGFGWFYVAGLECSMSQATIGKRWMGIKVTDAHGERMSFLRATGRYAAKYLSALPCLLGFIMALFSSRGLALHDRLSDTRVVRR